jgi:DNA-binding transcriptional ArsR family regulator
MSGDIKFSELADGFQLLSDRVRLRVVHELRESDRSVQYLLDEIGVAPSRLSFHLGKLAKAGVIVGYWSGGQRVYHYEKRSLDRLLELLYYFKTGRRAAVIR